MYCLCVNVYCHRVTTQLQLTNIIIIIAMSGFGGLGVACWPIVPKFAGSNPAEAVGFLRAKKSSARLSSEGSKSFVGPMSYICGI